MNNKINIREELNKIDNETFNEYDLRNMYDSCEWTKEEKKKIVESLKDVSKLNRIISGKFFGIKEPVKTKKVLNESIDNSNDNVLMKVGKYSIIKDGYGFGIDNGITVNRFIIDNDGKALYDYLPPKFVKQAVNSLIKKGVFNNPEYDENGPFVKNSLRYGSFNESVDNSKTIYRIKYWETEEDRDWGNSEIFLDKFTDLESAKRVADKLFDEYASVEVVTDLDTDDEEVVYGRYPDEPINEKVDNTGWANDYWHSISVEDENKKKITDWIMSSDSLLQAAYDYYKNDDVEALNDIAVEYLDTNYKPIDYYRTFEGSNEFGIRDKKTNELIFKSDNIIDINNWEDENNSWSDEDYDNALSIIKKAINEIGYYQWSNEDDEPQLTTDDMNAGQWYESLKEDRKEKEYKGYKLKFYSSDENPRWHNVYQVTKPRPYDDQEYYWASSYDGESWKIVYKRKVIDEVDCTFEEIVDKLEEKNKDIKPRILNDSLKESTAENIKDGSKDYTGKPFSDFLQDIDHRSRLWVEYKDYPGEVKGFGGMAHAVSWNFANCPIVSIEVPEDDRFNDFKVVIDASNAPRGINENLNEGYETIHCPDMSFQEIKDYCDAYECYVKNTGKIGEYIIYGIDSARVVDDLKADGLCESLNKR